MEARPERRRYAVRRAQATIALLAAIVFAARVPGSAQPASASYVVPFAFVGGHIFVDADVDGQGPYRFAVDSGAGNVVAGDVAAALGLKTGPAFTVYGTGEKGVAARAVRLKSLRLAGANLANPSAIVMSFDDLRDAEGVPAFAGLIGHGLFERYVVRIDYASATLTLLDPATFVAGPGDSIPFTLAGGTPLVEGDVDGIKGRFTLDTGDRGALSLSAPFVAAHRLIERYAPQVEGISGWGIGGPVRAYIVRPQRFRIGGVVVVDAPVTRLTQARHGFFTSDSIAGNIGNGVFERYVVTFDYAHRRVIFEAAAGTTQQFVYDRSGTWLVVHGTTYTVVDVVAGGPAAAAGLAAGDQIEQVDGRAASDLTLAALRDILRGTPGTGVVLRVKRGSQEYDLTIVLRDLV